MILLSNFNHIEHSGVAVVCFVCSPSTPTTYFCDSFSVKLLVIHSFRMFVAWEHNPPIDFISYKHIYDCSCIGTSFLTDRVGLCILLTVDMDHRPLLKCTSSL